MQKRPATELSAETKKLIHIRSMFREKTNEEVFVRDSLASETMV